MGLLSRTSHALFWFVSGCGFSPTLADQFACGANGECPSGLICAEDRICRNTAGGTSSPDLSFNLTPDAAVPVEDASVPPPPPSDMASPPPDLRASAGPDLAQPACIPFICDRNDCGDRDDGCGGTIQCGKCKRGQVCGATTPNRCGNCDRDAGGDCG